jgi:hypothetical protein
MLKLILQCSNIKGGALEGDGGALLNGVSILMNWFKGVC